MRLLIVRVRSIVWFCIIIRRCIIHRCIDHHPFDVAYAHHHSAQSIGTIDYIYTHCSIVDIEFDVMPCRQHVSALIHNHQSSFVDDINYRSMTTNRYRLILYSRHNLVIIIDRISYDTLITLSIDYDDDAIILAITLSNRTPQLHSSPIIQPLTTRAPVASPAAV